MLSNIITHMVVEFDSSLGSVFEYHFAGGKTTPRSTKAKKDLDRDRVSELIESYWKFVDHSIRQQVFTSEKPADKENFLSELESRGQELTDQLFTRSRQEEIWKIADEADVLLINTNLEEIPWEALFCAHAGDNSGFLSRNCIIQRHIECGVIEALANPENGDGVIICVDPELVVEEEERGELSIPNELSDVQVEVYSTRSSRELSEKVQNAGVIHWICEHVVDSGLRLGKGAFYSLRDIETHLFPRNAALFMLSCSSGRYSPSSTAYSARVSAASGCTVVAPSSMVAVGEAVSFVKDFQKLAEAKPGATLSEIWTLLKNPLGGRIAPDEFSWRDCYMLWFGIYGDCEVKLGAGR